MKAEIITIGDEILIGQIIDTNSAYIAQELNKIGVSVYQITSVQDDKIHILEAFQAAEKNVDIVVITDVPGRIKIIAPINAAIISTTRPFPLRPLRTITAPNATITCSTCIKPVASSKGT